MTNDLDALKAIAKSATQGPWENWNPCEGESHISIGHKVAWRSVESATPFADDEVIPHWVDANFIAAFDPPTVIALLDRLEELEARWARAEAFIADHEAREDNMPPKWFRIAVDGTR